MSTLNIRRITSSSDALYSGCVRIYEESFPYEERRDTAVMTGMLSDDRFHFIVFYGDREEDGPVLHVTDLRPCEKPAEEVVQM